MSERGRRRRTDRPARRLRRGGFSLGGLVAVNIIPLFASIAIAIGYFTGAISFRDVPEYVWWTGGGIAGSILLLSIFCWVLMPLVAGGAEAAQRSLGRTRRAMREGGAIGWVLRVPVLFVKGIIYLAFWGQTILVTALIIINVAAVAALMCMLLYEGYLIRGEGTG